MLSGLAGQLPILFALMTLCMATMTAMTCWGQAHQQIEQDREYKIKATYLYNFGRYVDWPAENFATLQSPFVIGIVGHDPFDDVLERIAKSRKISGREIEIRRFASPETYSPCQIVFVSRDAGLLTAKTMAEKTTGKAILLVTELPEMSQQGAVLNFYSKEDRIRFQVNIDAAARNKLKISAKLLSIGTVVKDQQPSPKTNQRAVPEDHKTSPN